MKNLFYLILFFIIISCSGNKSVYWCGDHPCINKKEKEEYFKKTMIVEIKKLNKKASKSNSEIAKIIQQAQVEEKRRIKEEKNMTKQAKLEEKRRIKEEKNMIKQAKLEEKRRIKEEKNMTKQAKLEEKRRIKEEKNLAKQIDRDETKIIKKKKKTSRQSVDSNTGLKNIVIASTNFEKLVENITKKSIFRPYPDINEIPD